ncbi:hypothetical protein GH714_012795 [Hevea brasiliensis]|uniref:CCHC-type domain-containing protein n=1 Tax=Hevea brasiliensis TaxID=3981 RepID=A0A6A6L153_HEVBR|nr:hypothetical protein GH714_012795 [Hevea brasiliensis]
MTDSQNSSYSVGTVTHAFNPSEDTSSPYYLHHSKNHSLIIVMPELTSANFAFGEGPFCLLFQLGTSKVFLMDLYRNLLQKILFISFGSNVIIFLLRGYSVKKVKNDVTCFHCGKPGNVKGNCYRLIGFPPNFKFTKSKGNASGSSSSKPASAY